MKLVPASAVVILALLDGCAGVKSEALETVVLQDGQQRQVKILAAGDWRDTGVVMRISKTYKISASGTWSIGGICGWTDASGAGVSLFCNSDPWGLGATASTLIGKIGSKGKPFKVGDRITLEPKISGNLYLRSYDLIPFDNSGAINVTISQPGPVIASTPEPAAAPKPAPASKFPTNPVAVSFTKGPSRPDDIAVIIGNADYSRGRDIPDVTPAYADANGIRKYVTRTLGVRKENIIFLKDASQAAMTSTFGSKDNPRGQLFNYVKPGTSRVFVYYSGHGAPGGKDGDSYIVPSNAQASTIELNGYPLKTLYRNLSQIPAKSITVVLEACFSGASQAGTVISNASPIYLKAKETGIPKNITMIAAGAANQIASWEQDKSSGLFTEYFLKGMSGEADAKPYGNSDGKVDYAELGRYLNKTMTYFARRYYGRDQTAQIIVGR